MPPNDYRRSRIARQQRSYLRPAPTDDTQSNTGKTTQEATAGIVRSQIESIFQQTASLPQGGEQPSSPQDIGQPADQPAKTEAAEEAAASFAETSHTSPNSPYDRTHERDRTDIRENQWSQYHSAWQNYYQQYYERYYLGEIYRMRRNIETSTPQVAATAEALENQLEDSDEAFHNLRADLLKNVRSSAVKVRGSRHFVPALAGGLTLLLFWFFIAGGNQLVFARVQAYASPGSIDPANIIVDPNIRIPISAEPRLIIPKINVDVPVVYDTKPDHSSQLIAMEKGVAWFGIPGANSRPGQIGNTVLSGHSSNDLFDPGDYKFIFARLEQLVEGDVFYVNYLGERYTYSITKKEVVKPTDVHKLVYEPTKPVMTLITCVPLGTAQNRLLVTAEQISPNPALAQPAPSRNDSTAIEEAAMPGNTPSFLGRLFGRS